jgi:hypothetical protein
MNEIFACFVTIRRLSRSLGFGIKLYSKEYSLFCCTCKWFKGRADGFEFRGYFTSIILLSIDIQKQTGSEISN